MHFGSAMIRRLLTCSALFVLLLALAGWGALRLGKSRTHQLVGELVTRADVSERLVALTFDDGPGEIYTDSVLDLLSETGTVATFFMVGQAMERRPEVVQRVIAAGHEIGNHTFSHPRMVLKRPSEIRRQIERTDSLIRAAGQSGEIHVRPPYGWRLFGLPWYLRRHDRPVLLWDVEPDTFRRDAEGMVAWTLDNVRPGSIILLHVELAARSEEREALARIVPELLEQGYRFVTVSELLEAAASNR